MTPDRQSAIYAEIERMTVPLERNPLVGPEYFSDRLHDVRRMQDRLSDLLVEIHRELAGTRVAAKAAKALARLTKSGPDQQKADQLELEYDSLRGLYEAANVRRSNLRQTGSDIRMLTGVLNELLKIGEVRGVPEQTTPQERPIRERTILSAEEFLAEEKDDGEA